MRIKTSVIFTVWIILLLVYAASEKLLSIQSLTSAWASISTKPDNRSVSTSKQESYIFTVQTVPQNATVKIMNIKPVYRKGMLLAPGKYHLNVSSPGHLTRDIWVNHRTTPGVFQVTLVAVNK